MSQPATALPLPPDIVPCPQCGRHDTLRFSWPDDPARAIFSTEHPETRVCGDCRYVWWPDEDEHAA